MVALFVHMAKNLRKTFQMIHRSRGYPNLAPTVSFIVQFLDSVAFGPYLAECDSVAPNTSPSW